VGHGCRVGGRLLGLALAPGVVVVANFLFGVYELPGSIQDLVGTESGKKWGSWDMGERKRPELFWALIVGLSDDLPGFFSDSRMPGQPPYRGRRSTVDSPMVLGFCRVLRRLADHPSACARGVGQTGGASSMRQTGPPAESGALALTNAGAVPPSTHTWESGGCLPTKGATSPTTPPSFTLTT
jgi:hypothetical protein